eukprot:TRINITY_DN3347_c0_g1_i4.p2 TRINITY_DN3347_c0_g1~~TRINITY_DN3347_c0_g1_i4.p2  ORF type:complete len:115 (-),score=34.12 TRINITY_DN3347_c0_g1_i4:28-372(-)
MAASGVSFTRVEQHAEEAEGRKRKRKPHHHHHNRKHHKRRRKYCADDSGSDSSSGDETSGDEPVVTPVFSGWRVSGGGDAASALTYTLKEVPQLLLQRYASALTDMLLVGSKNK